MSAHRDNHRHLAWNLEATASLLAARFPASLVWVVQPARMSLNTFSIFSNFVEFDRQDVPVFRAGQGSWRHLAVLLHNALKAYTKTSHGKLLV